MQSKRHCPPDDLTRRERDCLRLLALGLSAGEVATELGIRMATLNAHLAAVRRKLDVSTTRQAVALSGIFFDPPAAHLDFIHDRVSCHPEMSSAAARLEGARTFCEGWQVLVQTVARYGIAHVSSGLIAEPAGYSTSGGRRLRTTFLPTDFPVDMGQVDEPAQDPLGKYFSRRTEGRIFDSAVFLGAEDNPMLASLRAIAEVYNSLNLRYIYCQPARDRVTNASFALIFSVDDNAMGHGGQDILAHRVELEIISEMFWDIVQRKGWLKSASGLSPRQVEALQLQARGHTVGEAADRFGTSVRGYEKALAGARQALGARSTSHAVYKAMVYRAL